MGGIMNADILKPGDKIEIQVAQQLRQGRKLGELPTTYYSMVEDIREDGTIEALMPAKVGRNAPLFSGVRLDFVFYTNAGMYRCVAQVSERYVRENICLMLVEPKTPLEKFQRREYYRFGCVMDMQYLKITEEEAAIEDITELKEHHRVNYPEDFFQDAIAVDISGGGMRFIGNKPGETGDYLVISIRLESNSMDYYLEIVGRIMLCQKKESEKKEDKYEYRINFLMKNQKEREIIIKYIFEQERINRQKR